MPPTVILVVALLWLHDYVSVLDLTPRENSEGYLPRSRESLLSRKFYFSARPFVTSLMYKFYGRSKADAVLGQGVFSIVAWSFLSWVASLGFVSRVAKLLHCLVFPSLMFWWAIAGWNLVIRAESTAFSFAAIWIACLLLCLRKSSWVRILALALASFAFSFTRDNAPLLVLPLGAVTFFILVKHGAGKRATWVKVGVLALLLIGSFIFQIATTQESNHQFNKTRHEFPLANVVIRRILPHQERTEWFAERGMPVHSEILTWKKRWASGNEFALFRKKQYHEFAAWLRGEGRADYLEYLVRHPSYTIDSAYDARDALFSTELYEYTGKPQKSFLVAAAGLIWPIFQPWVSLCLACGIPGLTAFNWLRRRWNQRTGKTEPAVGLLTDGSEVLAMALLIVLVILNSAFVFHMDAMEVPRHCALSMPLLQVASYMLSTRYLAPKLLSWIESLP